MSNEPKRLPILFATAPRCECGSVRFRVTGHGRDTGDPDAKSRYVTCTACRERFLLVTEFSVQRG